MGKLVRVIGRALVWGIVTFAAAVVVFIAGCTAGMNGEQLDDLLYGGVLAVPLGVISGAVFELFRPTTPRA
jgi:hypothetical protein